MRIGELFAGIGGFGLAAERAGCDVRWASEIDDFATRVYEARFPDVRQLGDVTKVEDAEPVDCITAGFPCQDLSVAGKRKGLVGERSGLFWHITRIAARLRPRWLLLENVPGLLSSHRGRDFETVLAALDELGYGVAWRVLDAQHFGVPQRRRRVFIVGHLGGPCPAEVLFEPEGVSGDSPQGREAGAGVTGDVAACLNSDGNDGGFRTELGEHLVARPITSSSYKGHDEDTDTIITAPQNLPNLVTHALSSEGADANEDGAGRGTPIITDFPKLRRDFLGYCGKCGCDVEVDWCPKCQRYVQPSPNDTLCVEDIAPTLRVGGREQGAGSSYDNTPIVTGTLTSPQKQWNSSEGVANLVAGTVRTHNRNNSDPTTEARALVVETRPRRLTPRECERLQGFPDDWTLIKGASDSARYRALGNAVAVPCVEWIIRRLAGVFSP